jgi:chromosome segregation ATPase
MNPHEREVPDTNPGHKVGELANAVQSATQIMAMRADSNERRADELLRHQQDELARAERRREAWERARADVDKTRRRYDESRFDAGEAHRHAAVAQQRADHAHYALAEANEAPAELQPDDREIDRLRNTAETLAETAEQAHARAAKADRAATDNEAALRAAEQQLAMFETPSAEMLAAAHIAHREKDRQRYDIATPDAAATPAVDEHAEAFADVPRHAQLADREAAQAAELASRVAVPTTNHAAGTAAGVSTAPPGEPAVTRGRQR